jgi:hypothetical protein
MSTAKPLPLDRGGESWKGWRLGPYGRAREWRLVTPAGETFTAGDLMQLRGLIVDVDHLRGRVHELQGQVEAHACHFSLADLTALHAAIAVLDRALPAARHRRRRFTLSAPPGLHAVK